MTGRTIGFVFIEGYADWEFGLLSGSAAEWFGARCVALTRSAGRWSRSAASSSPGSAA
jgi:hypothetical protein